MIKLSTTDFVNGKKQCLLFGYDEQSLDAKAVSLGFTRKTYVLGVPLYCLTVDEYDVAIADNIEEATAIDIERIKDAYA